MITFTEQLAALNDTWREQPRHVRVIAARFYIGADNIADLRRMTRPCPISGRMELEPLLTERQVKFIIEMV